jgi:hypothetical protein
MYEKSYVTVSSVQILIGNKHKKVIVDFTRDGNEFFPCDHRDTAVSTEKYDFVTSPSHWWST